ncbi:hypothetical protein GJ654_05310 [Rhodoblastus acidophilus]|uniref:O-antigen ligase-related domain-containing protein n=1 Tax=Rhodoblastus acidophilus TaxID=1074 RepID=A0A6N8DJ76_RHOAC|nr:O-antigen ligase family protein [Rhodoblastus acidophilus]MCW2273506.1 type IV secretory pathway VirB2 component (pilin) [Rhodoblastus acidophilus]MTV30407.1 hypothetical protein [Rhodoblastus acidophilus]
MIAAAGRLPLLGLLAYALAAGGVAALGSPLASVAMLLPLGGLLLLLLPDQELVSPRLVAAAFVGMVAAHLCLPTYYMVQTQGLPWISLRRLTLLILLALALPHLATSARSRKQMLSALSAAPALLALNIGFDLMAGLSVVFSVDPAASAQAYAEAAFSWRLPFLACLIVVADEAAGVRLVRLIGVLCLPVAALGISDFVAEHNFALDILPKGLLARMTESNPGIRLLMEFNPWRNGFFRAVSIYNTPLSLGEFAAMCAPLGLFLLLHGGARNDRALGLSVIVAALACLFVSGSRGGSVAFLVAMPLLGLCWAVRLWRTRESLAGPIASIAVAMTGAAALAVVLTWKRLFNIVFGGGDSVGSTASRAEQAAAAWPFVLDEPVFGHGMGLAATVLDWRSAPGAPTSVDSYLISALIETGFPGAFCYFGAIALAACACLTIYLRDRDARAALAGPLGCSLIAYGIYRLALSQKENQTLLFILLALAFVCIREAKSRRLAR